MQGLCPNAPRNAPINVKPYPQYVIEWGITKLGFDANLKFCSEGGIWADWIIMLGILTTRDFITAVLSQIPSLLYFSMWGIWSQGNSAPIWGMVMSNPNPSHTGG